MSFYCKACARMPIHLISKAIEVTNEKLAGEKADQSDMKSKARMIKSIIQDLAIENHIDLR